MKLLSEEPRQEAVMGKFEKDLVKFMDVHRNCDKSLLIKNINQAIRNKGIYHRDKSRWVSEVTGTPIGTVYAWFTKADCREFNKIPPHAMCMIASALKVSVWSFFETEEEYKRDRKPNRKSSLYWYIRRNEAENMWNIRHASEQGRWDEQDKAVQRKFLDELYFEKLDNRQETG